jgi:hypothetical protein
VVYRWDKPVALGKSYTASRSSSAASGNPDSGGRELTNAIVVAPTDEAASEAVQTATAFWDAGEPVSFVVDLEKAVQVAGVRVSTHQPNARYCHPATVEVAVSENGHDWMPAGVIRHDDLWHPPGDYEAWEHDDDPSYAPLPAGGRLAYTFPLVLAQPRSARFVRFACTPLNSRGLGLSELAVFARAEQSPWPEDISVPDHSGPPRR